MVQHSLSSMELALPCNQYTEVPCRLKLLPGSQHCELMFVACWLASQRQPCRHNMQFTCNKPCLGILFGGMSSYMAPLGQQTQLTRQWFIRYAFPNPSTNGLCLHGADLCKVGKATCNTSMWVMGRKPHCSHKGAQVKLLHTPNCARELCTGMAVHTDWGVGGGLVGATMAHSTREHGLRSFIEPFFDICLGSWLSTASGQALKSYGQTCPVNLQCSAHAHLRHSSRALLCPGTSPSANPLEQLKGGYSLG
jgi:hypothetical protein